MYFFLFAMNLLIPLIMLGFGRIFLKSAPGEINKVYGYRTSMSMKNRDTWEFAHKYCGRVWCRWGLGLLLFSAAFMLFAAGMDEEAMGIAGAVLCVLQVVVLIASIFPTERALKRTFDRDGKRRSAG